MCGLDFAGLDQSAGKDNARRAARDAGVYPSLFAWIVIDLLLRACTQLDRAPATNQEPGSRNLSRRTIAFLAEDYLSLTQVGVDVRLTQ